MTTNLEDYAACLEKAAPEVTETLEATFHDAARLMSPAGLHEYMEGARALCNLGRGPDVVLSYLEEMPAEENRWDGECFVFDTRVAVDRDLAEGGYVQCHACRRPLSSEDMASPDYQEGVSCPKCISEVDDERKEGLRERQKQVELARERESGFHE